MIDRNGDAKKCLIQHVSRDICKPSKPFWIVQILRKEFNLGLLQTEPSSLRFLGCSPDSFN